MQRRCRMRRIAAITLLSAAGIVVAGCAGAQAFRPVNEARVDTPDAKGTVAGYDMKSAEAPLGNARVWSLGAYRAAVDGQPRTILQVALHIDNETAEPLALEALHLGWVEVNDTRVQNVQPIGIEGPRTIAPGAEGRLDAYFVIPTREEPNDVEGFRVDWTVARGDTRYRQSTAFEQATPVLLPTRDEQTQADDFPPALPPPAAVPTR